jgi:catechol 2,3-dioxygenase-like lactoylglutathione lyase family enzyme
MFPGWISLRVKDPQSVSEWYTKHLGLVVFGGREDIGSLALGTREHGAAIILLPGEPLDHAERLQLHFHVPDVDAAYQRLKREGVDFDEAPEDKPWGWRHAYTRDPVGHTVELCSPLPGARFNEECAEALTRIGTPAENRPLTDAQQNPLSLSARHL